MYGLPQREAKNQWFLDSVRKIRGGKKCGFPKLHFFVDFRARYLLCVLLNVTYYKGYNRIGVVHFVVVYLCAGTHLTHSF